jgi:hypothetical protein
MCEPGYVLSETLERCIPIPGAYVPFIFLAAALAWTIFALVMYKKGKIKDRYLLIT